MVLAGSAQAVEPVKIGMITTLSTKAGYLGEEVRDAFKLAIDQEGVPVELLVDDDGRKPEKEDETDFPGPEILRRAGLRLILKSAVIFPHTTKSVRIRKG